MKTPEQIASAWLHSLGILGLVLTMLFFLVYAVGMFPGAPTPQESAAMWDRPSGEYQDQSDVIFEPFWFLGNSDTYVLSSAALGVLASTAFPTLLALATGWFRRRDWLYGTMALLISAVIIVAISG